MAAKLVLLSVRIIEVMFFTGLIGCVFAVAFSWVSILKGIFLNED
jgi:hypothetical protein